jgi:hypothetical protein
VPIHGTTHYGSRSRFSICELNDAYACCRAPAPAAPDQQQHFQAINVESLRSIKAIVGFEIDPQQGRLTAQRRD